MLSLARGRALNRLARAICDQALRVSILVRIFQFAHPSAGRSVFFLLVARVPLGAYVPQRT